MILLENDHPIPSDIKSWAKEKNIPIIKGNAYGIFPADFIIEYSPDTDLTELEISYCHSIFQPAVIGETERLTIKELGTDDLKDYMLLVTENNIHLSDPSLASLSFKEFTDRHLAYIKYSYSFLGYGLWGIYSKENSLLGIAGLDGTDRITLSYALFEKYRGKGYAAEACSFILEYAEKHAFTPVIIVVNPNNSSSLKLASKMAEKFDFVKIEYS